MKLAWLGTEHDYKNPGLKERKSRGTKFPLSVIGSVSVLVQSGHTSEVKKVGKIFLIFFFFFFLMSKPEIKY